MGEFGAVVLGILVVVVAIGLLALPGIIAFRRGNEYKWIILIIGVTSPVFLGITWLVAIVWAAWPRNKSVIDPVLGNPSGEGRNAGDIVGEVAARFTTAAGGQKLERRLAEIDNLHARGMISDEERVALRSRAMEA